MSKKLYRLTVEPLTCVHIGTGNELTLLDYTTCKVSADRYLYAKFSSDELLRRIATDRQKSSEFERACSAGNMKSLQEFFQKNCDVNKDAEYLCEVTREFLEQYGKNKSKDPYDNAAVVEQMYRPGTAKPVIPGTSLKGAVRTAVLNDLLSKASDKDYNRFCDELKNYEKDSDKRKLEGRVQKRLLGDYSDAKNDPFRAVEIADCNFKAKGTQIVGLLKTISVNNHSGELFISNSMQIQAEAIRGKLMGACGIGESMLRINGDLQSAKTRKGDDAVSTALTRTDIVNACNYFYWREFEMEFDKFYKNASSNCDLIVQLREELDSCRKNKNQFIVRVGHWSQVEFVTFEENLRSPKTREIDGKKLGFGGTRTVFDYDGQYLPFGWCKCIIDEER